MPAVDLVSGFNVAVESKFTAKLCLNEGRVIEQV